ncbi:DUF1351 domain-containing protein [Companilactobacillus alimentarius]|uniref:DUF1351 domain-containing protein n=1 Tax=Companilactobacillus alimentarius TaxID=1602 RepID=UPI0028B67AF9|nr:DUF1351 domain-containing protein [Companilactobacillus alimentarius]MDT6953187.1 DUF1351 domain-containing protein [Companilactobacillus alimentarius]
MSNEVELTQNDFTVTFQPSQISINNFDELKTKINGYAKKYDGLVATDGSLKGAKSARAELNKLIKTINDKRIAVKRDYDEPYNNFKRDVDELQATLKSTIEPIEASIKTIETKQRDERTLKVRELINRMAPEYGLDPKDISIEDKWTNKISNMQLTKMLKEGFTAKKHIQDTFNANKKLVKEHCKLVDTDPAGWISQMNEDTDVSQIISSIDKSIDDEKKRREYDEAIKKMAQKHVDDKTIDEETGEIVEEDDDQPIDDDEPDKPDSYSMTFEVTGDLPVLKELYQFIDSKNLKFSVIKDPSKVSD